MTSISNIDTTNNTTAPTAIARRRDAAAAEATPTPSGRPDPDAADRVEVSDHARWLDSLRDLPVRADLVERIRTQIADGSYDLDSRLDQTASAIADDLTH